MDESWVFGVRSISTHTPIRTFEHVGSGTQEAHEEGMYMQLRPRSCVQVN